AGSDGTASLVASRRGANKLMRPAAADHGRSAAWRLTPYALRLTSFQLRFGPRLVLRGVALRLDARRTLGGRGLAPRLRARARTRVTNASDAWRSLKMKRGSGRSGRVNTTRVAP